MPSQTDLILRLLLAATLAGILGGERELTDQPAGFRTHILVGLGAALFTIISAFGFQSLTANGTPGTISADPTRIASQIVVGIGFLGGGAIIKYGATVRGLTTAASLWVTAAVGTAIGIGELVLGSVTAGITLVALIGLRPLRRIIRRHAPDRDELMIEATRSVDLVALLAKVRDSGASIESITVREEGMDRQVRLVIKPSPMVASADIAAALSDVEHVRHIDWAD
jgi:putative Mg2+ transporter-C (MgtC) family protein